MRTRSKKGLAILALFAILFTMIPVGAALASSVEVLSRPTVDDDSIAQLGTVFEESTAGQIQNGDTATIRLPEGFKFLNSDNEDNVMTDSDWATTGSAYAGYKVGNGQNYFEFPAQYLDNKNGLIEGGVRLHVTQLDDNEIGIEIDGTPASGLNNYLYLHLGQIYVDSGFSGDITLVIDAPSNSGVMSGSTTVGRVTGGAIDMEVTNVPTFSDNASEDGYLKVRIKEDTPGAFEDKSESVKMVLPNGFEFTSLEKVQVLWGAAKENNTAISDLPTYLFNKVKLDKDELTLNLPTGFTSTSAISVELTLDYNVEDETQAKLGEVTARIQGKSDIGVSELVVGQYGQYDVAITADDPPTVVAGMLEQAVAPVNIKESISSSLMNGRTLTLTLPSNAKWGAMDEDNSNGVSLDFVGFPGKDGQTAKWEVSGESNDAAELALDDLEVVLEPGYEGDLVAEVGGTAGLKGQLVLGKEVKSVNIKADSKPVIGIGEGAQEVGDLTITEAQAEAISDDCNLVLDLPEGVSFAGTPKVEVTEGDLDIDQGGLTTGADSGTDDNQVIIPIDGKSSIASTIKVTGIKLSVTRSVPQGDVWVKVKGDAVGEVNNWKEVSDYFTSATKDNYVKIYGQEAFDLDSAGKIFPETATAAKDFFATVGTPAPGETANAASFVIGDTKYTVNGQEQTMDVAPYLKNGRTYLPVRYTAMALGVDENNILWDGKNATLIKGDKVVQLTPGSSVMKVNGANITMDVPAELTSGRVMLPFRWIAQAFGAQVSWDEATQTVSMQL